MPGEPLPLENFRPYLCLLARARMGPLLRGRQSASDLVQETLLLAHREAEQFRGTTSEEQAAWLRRILERRLANLARDETRDCRDVRRERPLQADDSVTVCLAAVQSTPSQQAVCNEQLLLLAGALAELPEAQREAVELRYLHGWGLNEIAERLERTAPAAANLLHRGLTSLRQRLREGESR